MNLAGQAYRQILTGHRCLRALFPHLSQLCLHRPSLCSAFPSVQYHTSNRLSSSSSAPPAGKMESLFMKFGFKGFTVNHKANLDTSSIRLYVACTKYADFDLFKRKFNIDDTMANWALVVQLHTWMLLLRMKNHKTQLHRDYEFMLRQLNTNMWFDIEKRSKNIASGSVRKKGLKSIIQHYETMLVKYDEGYFTDDKTLATAVWSTLFSKDPKTEPKDLLYLIDYIHKNLNHLESLPDEELLKGYVSFIPLDTDQPDAHIDREIHELVSTIK